MVLQRYRATKELGKGSFGTVYLTEGRRDKRHYVVKVVDNLRENNLKVQEIRVMMHLKHRNIVEMCDFYTSNNQLCIVMEFADGGDLRKEILKARQTKTSISEELITIWLIQVCQALDYAHDEQIIHRDIKPSNIFLQADGKTVKVGDFGISRVLDAASGRDQMAPPDAEGRVGTKRYMAPEVLNKQDYSNKADIWSLGCVLFELLTLNHPTYEPDRRIWFEWIPTSYSQNMMQVIRSMLSERAVDRPSPKELLIKLATPYMGSPSVQQEFLNAMQWYDQRMMQQRQLFESQALIIRQFTKSHRIPQVTPLAPQPTTPQGSSKDHAPPAPPRTLSEENYPGTGLVLGIAPGGLVKVMGLVGGGRAEASRQIDVGDALQEVDGAALGDKHTELPMQQLRGRGGASVRLGLQKASGKRVEVTLPLSIAATLAGVDSQGTVNGSTKAAARSLEQPLSNSSQVQPAAATPAADDLEHFNIPEYIEDPEIASQDDTPPAVERVPSSNDIPATVPSSSVLGEAVTDTARSATTTVLAESTQPSSAASSVKSNKPNLTVGVPTPSVDQVMNNLTPSPLPRAAMATPHDVPQLMPAQAQGLEEESPQSQPIPSPKALDPSQQRSATGAEVTTWLTQSNAERDKAYSSQQQQQQQMQQQMQQQQQQQQQQQTSARAEAYGAPSEPKHPPAAPLRQSQPAPQQQQQQQPRRSEAYAPQLIQPPGAHQQNAAQSAMYGQQQQHVPLAHHQQPQQSDYLSHRQAQNAAVYSDYPQARQQQQQMQQPGYMPPDAQHNLGASLDARSMQYAHGGYDRYGRVSDQERGLGRSFDEYGRRAEQQQPPSSPSHQQQQQHPPRSSFNADSGSSYQAPSRGAAAYQQMPPQPHAHAHAYARHPVNTWQSGGQQEQQPHAQQYPSMRSSADGREASNIAAEVMAGRGASSLGRSLDAASMRRAMMSAGSAEAGGSSYSNSIKASQQQQQQQRFGAAGDTETSKVLQELERVRSGIQETLAKAAAAGKLGEGGSDPAPARPLSFSAAYAQPASYASKSASAFQSQSTYGQQQPAYGMQHAYGATASGSAGAQQPAYGGSAGQQVEDEATGSKYSFAEL